MHRRPSFLWPLLAAIAAIAPAQSVHDHGAPGTDLYNCTPACTGAPLALNSSVPNVLLLSDSIGARLTGYFDNVVRMLGPGDPETGGGVLGNAAVQHTGGYGKGICGTSFGALACADLWLGSGNWSVIQ